MGVLKHRPAPRKRRSDPLIAVPLALMLLLQAPAFQLYVEEPLGGQGGSRAWRAVAPLEAAAMTAARLAPALGAPARAALLPGRWAHLAVRVAHACALERLGRAPSPSSGPCDAGRLTDLAALWEQSDPLQLQGQWEEALGEHDVLLAATCAITVLCGLASVLAVMRALMLGLGLMLTIVLCTPECRLMPNLVFFCFLGGLLVFQDWGATRRERAAQAQRQQGQASGSGSAAADPKKQR